MKLQLPFGPVEPGAVNQLNAVAATASSQLNTVATTASQPNAPSTTASQPNAQPNTAWAARCPIDFSSSSDPNAIQGMKRITRHPQLYSLGLLCLSSALLSPVKNE